MHYITRCQIPIPRGFLTSNRPGRSSDLLLFRSLPGPCGPVARCSEPSRSFTAAGLSGICTRFPFHSSSTPGKESTKPAAKITLLSEKPPEIADYFHQPQPESAGKDPIPACASTRKNIPNITLMYQIRIQSFLHIYFPFCSCRIFVNFAAIIFSH